MTQTFIIESILNVDDGRKGKRTFEVKYKGYPDTEPEQERNLIGCKDTVNIFLIQNKANGDETKDWRLMDLEEEEEEDENEENEELTNMITAYKLLQYLKTMRKARKEIDQTTPIGQFIIKPTNRKQIYIYLLSNFI